MAAEYSAALEFCHERDCLEFDFFKALVEEGHGRRADSSCRSGRSDGVCIRWPSVSLRICVNSLSSNAIIDGSSSVSIIVPDQQKLSAIIKDQGAEIRSHHGIRIVDPQAIQTRRLFENLSTIAERRGFVPAINL